MNRAEAYEKAFKKRYNRDTVIHHKRYTNEADEVIQHTVSICCGEREFTLNEFLQDGTTVSVTVTHKGVVHKYDNYLWAEVQVADAIGEEM